MSNSSQCLFAKKAYSRGQYVIFKVVGPTHLLNEYVNWYIQNNKTCPTTQDTHEVALIANLASFPEANFIQTARIEPWVKEGSIIGWGLDVQDYRANVALAATMPPAVATAFIKDAIETLRQGVDIPADFAGISATSVQTTTVSAPDLDNIFQQPPAHLGLDQG